MENLLDCTLINRSTKNAQIALAIPLGLALGYLLINLINSSFHDRLFLPDWMSTIVTLFILLIIAEIFIWYYTKGQLIITRVNTDTMEIDISFPRRGEIETKKGKWTCVAQYTKTYAKYGMYYKNLALALFCNGVPFCLLRHQLGGLDSAPDGFTQVETLYNPAEVEYWCKKTPAVFEILKDVKMPEAKI